MINKTRQSGVTLPEMMTAVAITLIMLAASGMIFSSASKSSGKAMALNDIMKEARVITAQLESDFAGYRDDLPITLLFEGYNFNVDSNLDGIAESNYLERRDRISFFTNGDFQDMSGTNRTLMARVLYSQTGDTLPNQNTDGINPSLYSGISPQQRMLCRQMKMITTNSNYLNGDSIDPTYAGYYGGFHYAYNNWLNYELETLEYGPEYLWKNADINNFYGWWLDEDENLADANIAISFIRRPDYKLFYNTDLALTMDATLSRQRTNLYKQKNCMVKDCTDLTIQAWLIPPGEVNYRWFPSNWDLQLMSNKLSYWADKGMFAGVPCLGISWNISPVIPNQFVYGYYNKDTSLGKYLWPNDKFWDVINGTPDYVPLAKPKAFKFTFKLHDESRAHFPEGKKFSYIIDVRDKD